MFKPMMTSCVLIGLAAGAWVSEAAALECRTEGKNTSRAVSAPHGRGAELVVHCTYGAAAGSFIKISSRSFVSALLRLPLG